MAARSGPGADVVSSGGGAESARRAAAAGGGDAGRSARPRPDQAEAERLFRRAAEHGQATALANLGLLREANGGDDEAALRTWRDAANRGVPEACDRLGRAYRDGELGLAVDDAEARRWFQRAADLGYASGALNLGAMMMLGRGGQVDEAGALGLYRRAAEAGQRDRGGEHRRRLLGRRGGRAERTAPRR